MHISLLFTIYVSSDKYIHMHIITYINVVFWIKFKLKIPISLSCMCTASVSIRSMRLRTDILLTVHEENFLLQYGGMKTQQLVTEQLAKLPHRPEPAAGRRRRQGVFYFYYIYQSDHLTGDQTPPTPNRTTHGCQPIRRPIWLVLARTQHLKAVLRWISLTN